MGTRREGGGGVNPRDLANRAVPFGVVSVQGQPPKRRGRRDGQHGLGGGGNQELELAALALKDHRVGQPAHEPYHARREAGEAAKEEVEAAQLAALEATQRAAACAAACGEGEPEARELHQRHRRRRRRRRFGRLPGEDVGEGVESGEQAGEGVRGAAGLGFEKVDQAQQRLPGRHQGHDTAPTLARLGPRSPD